MFLGVLLLMTNIFNIYVENHENINLWKKFKVDFNKSYSSLAEEEKRREIFQNNLRTSLKHNLKYMTGLSTYQMGINQFSDVTFEEFYKLNTATARILTSNYKDLYNAEINTVIKSNPINVSSFDWRDFGAVSSVKDQGLTCGCCYAFASVSSLESQIFLKTKKFYDFSEQEIVDCAVEYVTFGCNGGFEIGALNYIQNNGEISLESDYPYKEKQEKCQNKKSSNSTKFQVKIKGFLQLPAGNEEEMKRALVNYGPLIISIDHLHESFIRYSSGIYYQPDCKKISTHAALLVGFGSENGNDYWIVKNSYGITYGENGYIRIARNKNNHCEIASEPYILQIE